MVCETLHGCLHNTLNHHVPANNNHPNRTSALIIAGGKEKEKKQQPAGPLDQKSQGYWTTGQNPGKCGLTECCKPTYVFVSYCHSLLAAGAVKLNIFVVSWKKGCQKYCCIYHEHPFYLPISAARTSKKPPTHTPQKRKKNIHSWVGVGVCRCEGGEIRLNHCRFLPKPVAGLLLTKRLEEGQGATNKNYQIFICRSNLKYY